MIIAVIAITAFLITVLALFFVKGIRVKAYFDLQTGTFVSDVFVFGNVHALKYKAFECNGNFYSQINSRELKKITLKTNDNKQEQENSKNNKDIAEYSEQMLMKFKTLTDVISEFGILKLKTLRAYLTIGTGNSMSTSLIASSLAALLGALQLAVGEKIKVKNADISVYPNFRYENTVFTFEADTGASVWRLIYLLIYIGVMARTARKKVGADEA